jgi:hypothetical protein
MWLNLISRHRLVAVTLAALALPSIAFSTSFKVQEVQRHQAAAEAHARAVGRAAEFMATMEAQGRHTTAAALPIVEQERDQAWSQLDEKQQALDAANADNAAKQQKIDDLTAQLAARAAVGGMGGGGVQVLAALVPGLHNQMGPLDWHHYVAGQCTAFVASWRAAPWGGNAIEWWANAAGYRPEGQTPQVGAIMVSREGYWGHVALVEQVYSATRFLVSEQNYYGAYVIDQRIVDRATTPVSGFIY